MKHQWEQANKEKKKAEDDLYITRDKLREVLNEKIALENELSHHQHAEDSQLTELEQKFMVLNDDYKKTLEDNRGLRKRESELKKEVEAL